MVAMCCIRWYYNGNSGEHQLSYNNKINDPQLCGPGAGPV